MSESKIPPVETVHFIGRRSNGKAVAILDVLNHYASLDKIEAEKTRMNDAKTREKNISMKK
jgi:hypothetical protein